MACLAKDPDARPQSTRELSQHLAAVSLPAWTPQRAEAWWRTHLPDVLADARSPRHDSDATAVRRRVPPAIRRRSSRHVV